MEEIENAGSHPKFYGGQFRELLSIVGKDILKDWNVLGWVPAGRVGGVFNDFEKQEDIWQTICWF